MRERRTILVKAKYEVRVQELSWEEGMALLDECARRNLGISGKEPWQVSLAGYRFTLGASDGRELVSFHWHPTARGEITFPHLHLGAAGMIGYEILAQAHVPPDLSA
jgi:hypothetical protein